MELSETKKKEYIKRLLLSRMRILVRHGFFGLLLMHMKFSLDEGLDTAATDGMRIYFNPAFLEELSDSELDFVMLHEILHVELKHCVRGKEFEAERFNIACDIVVNSNILLSNNNDVSSITLEKYGEAMHTTPNGEEGSKYTAEEVYKMLPDSCQPGQASEGGTTKSDKSGGKIKSKTDQSGNPGFDDHSMWNQNRDNNDIWDQWTKRICDAAKAIEIRDPSNTRGLIPACIQRILKDLRKPQIDWRTILTDFIQEDVVDYSFTPPDRRFDDSPFFLPDFNEKDEKVEDILFMIDTSGSMSDDMITAAYSEVKGAIDQFDGKLQGWLGFFDAAVVEPIPFTDEDELKLIRPAGGGGTSFEIIFRYVTEFMQERLPVSIIVLTDGYAPFPDVSITNGIPVLWLLNNMEVEPPWGKVARIIV